MISRLTKVVRLAQELAMRARAGQLNPMVRLMPRVFPPSLRMDVAFRRTTLPPTRNPFLRMARIILRGGRAFRPFSSLSMNHQRPWQQELTFRRFQPYARHRPIKLGPLDSIKGLFSSNVRYNKDLVQDVVPNTLDGYDIGENIGIGSNAAVYALRVREPEGDGHSIPSTSTNSDSLKNYPLALKLMFNYELDRNLKDDAHLWRAMGKELVPLPESTRLLKGRMGNYQPLPRRHPNVVRLLTAFVDRMPILSDAREKYPEALPSASYYEMIVDEPRTMFVVMKRYRMDLREYVRTQRRNYWTGRVMLGQLLEGCAFLHDHVVAQRDLKSDNILLDFDHPDDVPHLVISDFGCALADGTWDVSYSDDAVDLGGNLSTRAPEVRTAKAHPEKVVDFRLADTWAAGGLAYEIFTRRNPFYNQLRSDTYLESEVPPLPSRVHHAVRGAVKDILRRDPEERLLPHVAANVVCLSLFRFGGDVRAFLADCGVSPTALAAQRLRHTASEVIRTLGERAESALDGVLSLLAAESMVARGLHPPVVSEAELQLRATFLSRVDRGQLWQSIGYFFDSEDRISLNCLPTATHSNDNGISVRIASR